MTLAQLLRILIARKHIVLGVLVFVLAADVAVTTLLPRKYTAVATVLSDPRAPDPVYGYMAPNYNYNAAGNIATQADIIASNRVARLAVQLLGLEKDAGAREMWQAEGEGKGSLQQFLADYLLSRLDAKPSHESDVIAIQFTGPDPSFAAAAANAFAKAYVDVSLELRTDPARASSEFFDARTNQLRDDLAKAQTRLSDFQQKNGVVVTDERLDVESARLNELATQLTAIQALRSESQSRRNQALAEASTSPDVLQSPVIQQLRTDIARTEAKVHELRNQFGENHPQLKAAQTELESLKAKLQAEMRTVAGSIGTADLVNLQREAEIKAALEEQKKRVLQLRSLHDRAAVLQRDVEEAQKAYDLVAQRRSQTNLESLNQQSNVAVLSIAQVPTEPSRPRVALNVLLGIFLGGLLGIAAALARELRDRRVRGVEDIKEVFLGLPLLTTLPPARRGGMAPRERPLRLQYKRRALEAAG